MRLLEAVVPEESLPDLEQILEEGAALHHWSQSLSDERVLIVALVDNDKVEGLMDDLESRLKTAVDFRLILLAVEASLPREELEKQEEEDKEAEEKNADRISREELYDDISESAKLSANYFALVVLSTVVAAFGLIQDSPAAIIGAMVMAPLLGPNVALALATTLGDGSLAWRALRSNVAGALIVFALSAVVTIFFDVDLSSKEITSRAEVDLFDILVALSAGIAGSLAFTTGMAASIIGVMVAVALLPPLVVSGLYLGAQEWGAAYRAIMLVLVNVTAVNLAGVGTFLAKGIRPVSWWEKERARRASLWAGMMWVLLLLVLGAAILLGS